jgi:glycosyltransferase involved in cell wall biosynthesis
LRVLIVNHPLFAVLVGGTAERTFQMSRFLASRGVECTLLTSAVGLTPARVAALASVKLVAVPPVWHRFYVPRVSWRLVSELVGAADIIHLMGHWSPLNAMVYWAARQAGKPYVICPAGSLPLFGRSRRLKQLYNVIAGRSIVRNASACIAISPDEIDHFAAYGVPADKVHIIPNGIDPDDYAESDGSRFRASAGIANHPFVLFVGRLNPIKGPDLLLRAFCDLKNDFPDFHLVFAGPDGGMLKSLEETTREEGMTKRVHFVGYVGGADKASAYCAASLLAIPSRQEAMSIVVLEAGITKTPVLLTDQCGLNVVAGIGGEVVPPTVEGIRNGLSAMLADPASLAAKGEQLGIFTREHYLWTSIVQAYLTLYEQLLRARAR